LEAGGSGQFETAGFPGLFVLARGEPIAESSQARGDADENGDASIALPGPA
jgi:hypothetical protein